MKYDLYNKNVFISGVSGGIGRELALKLVKDYGCKVFGVARNEEKLNAVKAECCGGMVTLKADISLNESWQEIAFKMKDWGFYPDIIINNAGIIHPFDSFVNLSENEIESVINTNYKSHIYCARNLLPLLLKSAKPAVINIISAAATLPLPGTSIYSSSKRAALAFTEVLSQELCGVYVAAVLSGPVKTGLYSARGNKGEEREKVNEGIISKIGVSAKTEAERIIKGITKGKRRIVSGITAKLMDFSYKKFPRFSVAVAGVLTRLLPLKTFKRIFKKNNKK